MFLSNLQQSSWVPRILGSHVLWIVINTHQQILPSLTLFCNDTRVFCLLSQVLWRVRFNHALVCILFATAGLLLRDLVFNGGCGIAQASFSFCCLFGCCALKI